MRTAELLVAVLFSTGLAAQEQKAPPRVRFVEVDAEQAAVRLRSQPPSYDRAGEDAYTELRVDARCSETKPRAGVASRIQWTATVSDTMDVKVSQFADDYAPGEGYDITVTRIPACAVDVDLLNEAVTGMQTVVAENDITTGPAISSTPGARSISRRVTRSS